MRITFGTPHGMSMVKRPNWILGDRPFIGGQCPPVSEKVHAVWSPYMSRYYFPIIHYAFWVGFTCQKEQWP
ncbi:hypothetical protein BDQ94DRAFT_143908 [Aspergillus welwitschiae]|uniref:Uncharacterized protein n=1 Tax=Aspergillus welwitschiae TaxID=1341132 RepID=A0A3F3Q2Q4_9EURO|nr:hypothetical protein BDQ94DRAFT_143908 [Aspergillus welwitschiae]RDH33287.1 hypothetical protein BDQ94DRAFT_143908 [Aspergillus welwitschiae]